jgi:WhiB family transcriptional regulator, redox-sensing transcriptional regulator
MTAHPRYDVDDVPVAIRHQIRGGWGILAPQIFGIADFVPEVQFSGRAACSGTDPNCFFPEQGQWGNLAMAQRICAGCPIKTECREWAIENHEVYGIWGGTTYRQRQQIWVARDRANERSCK